MTQRRSTVPCEKAIASACEKVITPAHEKANASAHEKAIATVCEKVIISVDPGGLMINAERIISQLSNETFKRFNLFFLYVGIKTVYITVYNQCQEDQQSLHVKR